MDHLHYAVLLPPLEVCLGRVGIRQWHGFTDQDAAAHRWHEFHGAALEPALRLKRSTFAANPWRRRRQREVGHPSMILPKVPDPRFVTLRRGGSLTDADHHALALWAAACAEHVLPLFEDAQPGDSRPREAIAAARAWVRGEMRMMQARAAGGHAMGAARPLGGAPRFAAYAAGQAGAVAHVAAHELGSAAYAIKAVRAAAADGEAESAGLLECQWQRDQLPESIRELVLDDQRLRNEICWSVFDWTKGWSPVDRPP